MMGFGNKGRGDPGFAITAEEEMLAAWIGKGETGAWPLQGGQRHKVRRSSLRRAWCVVVFNVPREIGHASSRARRRGLARRSKGRCG